MKIAIIATHAHALPSKAHTGDSQIILDLCWALNELGHEVTLLAPEGTVCPSAEVFTLGPREGETGEDWERQITEKHAYALLGCDVAHDFTIGKSVHRRLTGARLPSVSTLLGGSAYTPLPNTVVWSEAMRDRVMRGATDYEGTAWPEKGGPACAPFKDVRVVHGGIDTEFYSPGPASEVGGHFLWMNRWAPEKGFAQAIELAKSTGIELLMVGDPPTVGPDAQRNCALEAMRLAQGAANITFEWLPGDPDHHTAKRDQYRRARALLYPAQFQEPFGLSMVEAMACGTPVVGADMGSVREVLSSDYMDASAPECFVIAEPAFWANAVQVLWDPEDRERARTRAVRRFDRRVMAANYLKLYKQVIAGEGWG